MSNRAGQSFATLSPIVRPSLQPALAAVLDDINQEYDQLLQNYEIKRENNWTIGNKDISLLFINYCQQANTIPKPISLESDVQDILALFDVLFLPDERHNERKMTVFGVQLLEDLSKHQIQKLIDRVPSDIPNFTIEDYMPIANITNDIDNEIISPRAAKLRLLTLAATMGPYKANVIEGIADLLTKLPLSPIADESQLEELDVQTRHYDPLLSSMFSDTSRNVALMWDSRKGTLASNICPTLIESTSNQSEFGFGEIKVGMENTVDRIVCLDTLKLALLSRNSVLKYNRPILTFQIKGFEMVFFITQIVHNRFFTMTEIGRVRMIESLSTLDSFVTLKNLNTLLRVTMLFWHCYKVSEWTRRFSDILSNEYITSTTADLESLLESIDNFVTTATDVELMDPLFLLAGYITSDSAIHDF